MVELTPKQQVVDNLKNNKNFLILTHKDPDGDAIGSAIALFKSLRKLNKKATIVCTDSISKVYDFLPDIDKVANDFSGKREFIISIDVSQVKADKIMYKISGDRLNVVITPKQGEFSPEKVTFPKGKTAFDSIVVLDSPALERIGQIYDENSEIFYETPIVNIDHHSGNDYFGKINLIDLTATSTAEILVSVIEALSQDQKFFDEDISTALLTGIISDTNSFQNTNTTPKSLTVAAQLVASGGKQQEIIKRLFKTKSLSTLRLWGRALSLLRDESQYRFVWTEIFKKDFAETGATEDASSGLIDELLKTASGVDFALLLSEKNGSVHGSLRSTKRSVDVSAIANLFGGGGHPMAAAFQIAETSLSESSDRIIEKIRAFQREKNQ